MDLIGGWRFERSTGGNLEPHTLEFTEAGDLIYSYAKHRSLLTYELDGYTLVTDQPSDPRIDRMPIVVTLDDELVIGEGNNAAYYTRDRNLAALDPIGKLSAFAGHALRHAVASSHLGEAFTPFVCRGENGRRFIERLVAAKPEEAAVAARRMAHDTSASFFGYCYDGYITLESGKRDAAFFIARARGSDKAIKFAQAYRPNPPGFAAEAIGNIVPFLDEPDWFAKS